MILTNLRLRDFRGYERLDLIGTQGAVLYGMIYNYLPFMVLPIHTSLKKMDQRVIEAAQDLGAGWWTTLWRVLIPMLAPGILAGGLLAFTLSIDDFVISFFVAGPGSTTLPIRIYSMIKYGAPPLINALSTILLVVTFACVTISQLLSRNKRAPGT